MTAHDRTPRRSRAPTVAGVAVFALAAMALLPASGPHTARKPASTPPVSHRLQASAPSTLSAPAASSVTSSCELPDPAEELGPTSYVPLHPVAKVISPAGGVWGETTSAGRIYVLNQSGMSVYSDGGALESHFGLPSTITGAESGGSPVANNGVSQPIVDPSGDIWISSYYGPAVVEVSPSGAVERNFDPDGNPTDIFALHSTSGVWQLGVSTTQDKTGSVVYDRSGSRVGTTRLIAGEKAFVDLEPDHDILDAVGDGLVQTWNPEATSQLHEFGSTDVTASTHHTGGPFTFFYEDESVEVDGEVYDADGLPTITETQPDGVLLGATTLGGQMQFEGDLSAFGSNLVAQTGPPFDDPAGTVSIIPVADVTRYLAARQPAPDFLGWGAGLQSSAAGNYYPPGSSPYVTATFAPWWRSLASHLQLTYRVWDLAAINSGELPRASTLPLPDTTDALSAVRISLGRPAPGPYEVEAQLLDTSTKPAHEVGATCMPVTIGATGDHLDFATLPAGRGAGGPQDPRGVALNAQLGLDGLRSVDLVDWTKLLPDCNAGAPSASTCGPGALQLAKAPTGPYEAAHLADEDHVHYWIQVSGGDPVSLALVDSGLWHGDIQALVAHYAHPPTGCRGCAAVTDWEPWNEANNTGWSDPQQYVTKVLAPFYEAVKAAEPDSTVLGGSSLEVDLGWWQGLIAAGGLHYLDVASVHPYPGNNDSWEEDGIETQLGQLKAALGHVPLWLSEIGWWSDGGYDFTHQADALARAMIWQKLIGIPVWNYFFDEGSFGNDGVTFSLIQAADGADAEDYVKPAALAIMQASTELRGRTSLGQVPSQIPLTWDARFGPDGGGTSDLAAVWTDGIGTTAALSTTSTRPVPITVTNQYGEKSSATLQPGTHYALHTSDQVVYLSYPQQDRIEIAPPEAYGTDLALASSGATATASSGNGSAALVDPSDATDYGQGWASSAGDASPTLTVKLAKAAYLNRVVVDTQSVGSVADGLRAYTLAVERTNGTWQTVASVSGEFRYHAPLLAFDPIEAVAVRISVSRVDIGGYYGGGLPNFCTVASCPSVAFVHAIEIYSGSALPRVVRGTELHPL